jgi:hypothetical protein
MRERGLSLLFLLLVGCGRSEAVSCVDEINRLRATLNLPALGRWQEAEGCSDAQAQADSSSGKPHGAFGKCQERAQNECPGWPGPPEKMIAPCLSAMWAEGPDTNDGKEHGHYVNMTNNAYTKVACGFAVTPQGKVWAVQNFK